VVCALSRDTGSGGLTGAGRGCRSLPMDRCIVSLRSRAYGIHILDTLGSFDRSSGCKKSQAKWMARNGPGPSLVLV
jgi:hypothetical protein